MYILNNLPTSASLEQKTDSTHKVSLWCVAHDSEAEPKVVVVYFSDEEDAKIYQRQYDMPPEMAVLSVIEPTESDVDLPQGILINVDVESWVSRPAVTSRGESYLIENDLIVGKVRTGTGRMRANGLYEYVCVQPDDDATRAYFKDDHRMIDGFLFGVKYDGVFGDRWLTGDDGDEPRYVNTKVVDTFEFDFGIAHESFSKVPGFGKMTDPKRDNHLRIKTKQKVRRRRNSHKIKKVA